MPEGNSLPRRRNSVEPGQTLTNRKVGDCGGNLGLEVLRRTVNKGDCFGYITHTRDGKILKSSTIYVKDPQGKAIGSICINLDVSNIIMANRM
ncbi:MAG: PAS domain-containing protein, partial [Planctomycetota bacterium]|nr:PAS domain-containing protein [Planctomycetota bacterium]